MTTYYDVILGLIPLVLIGISSTLYAGGISLTTAVSLGGGVAVLLVGHALFVRSPVDDGPAVNSGPAPVTAD